jgi:tRNA-Thr(GGU) m(6)t(6)A37 methyltransferase TsaA
MTEKTITFRPIGVVRTPYAPGEFCPQQPVEREEGEARIEIDPALQEGLDQLGKFRYIYVITQLDQARPQDVSLVVAPPWAGGHQAGVFATRSPDRPAPIGLSVVRLRRIEDGVLVTGMLDLYDGTPVLDVKPYIRDLDAKADADLGWIGELDDHHHLLDHVRGIPHGHGH